MKEILNKYGIEFTKKDEDMFCVIKIVREPISFQELVGIRE